MMALFPGYAQDITDIEIVEGKASEPSEVSPGREMMLLASDSGTDDEPPARPVLSRQNSHQESFYWDTKLDCGNLRVSTLYYPGRPQYTLSANPWGCGGGASGAGGSMARRYYHSPVADAPAHRELHERAAAYRRMLADHPADQDLWLQYIDFQEQWCDGEAALRAAEEAAAAVGRGAGRGALSCTLQRLRATHLSRDAHLALLRDELAAVQPGAAEACAAWARLAAALGAAGTRAPALAAAALPRLAHAPRAYPHLLYIHGATLRAAGLWEQLVLLVELVAAMNYPPAGFPPPPDEARLRAVGAALLAAEDKATCSGLPLSAVWVRVERARAAAHWRPASDPQRDPDPQRCPLPADVADLLLPVADDDAAFLLCVNLLRLAKVPLMPAAEYVARACGMAGLTEEEVGGAWWCAEAEALVPLLRAARRLPRAHPAAPAEPAVARSLLAHFLDPPHYFTDENGYLGWVTALWEASCAWMSGARRVALLCWRLRWLHALALLLERGEGAAAGEARRLRAEARGALKRFAGDSPLPYALFARLEAVLQPARAVPAALHALRAALADPHCPVTHRLYVARVVREVCAAAGGAVGDAAGAWAVPCAVLGRAVPSEAALAEGARPDEPLLRAALLHCEERCSELETRFSSERGGNAWSVCGALGAGGGAGEWGGARVALAGAARRSHLARALPPAARGATNNAEGLRFYEQSACALMTARDCRLASEVAEFADLFPHNALLALGVAGAPLWRRGRSARAARTVRSHAAALAGALPALLRAAAAGWAPREAERAYGACVRAARGGAAGAAGAGGAGGALLAAAALEAAARGAGGGGGGGAGRAHRALLAALDAFPDHKWLYVRGAAWVPAEADALADVLLERQLRLHALRDELHPELHPVRLDHTQHHTQHHTQQHTQHTNQ